MEPSPVASVPSVAGVPVRLLTISGYHRSQASVSGFMIYGHSVFATLMMFWSTQIQRMVSFDTLMEYFTTMVVYFAIFRGVS